MQKLSILLFLSVLFSGCAALKTESARTDMAPSAPYSVIGDATFPALAQNDEIKAQISDEQTVSLPYRSDVWQRLRDSFKLNDVDHPRIQRQLEWYARHPNYINRVVERARPYMYFIAEEVESAGIPAELALLPIVESAFQPFA